MSADRTVRVDDLAGFTELATRLGVARNTLHHYAGGRHSALSPFPQPVVVLNGTRVYLASEVQAWLREWYGVRQPGHRTDRERESGGVAAYPEQKRKPRERKTGRSVPRVRSKPPTAISSDVADKPAARPEVRVAPGRVTCRRAMCSHDPEPGSVWCWEHEPEVLDAAWKS